MRKKIGTSGVVKMMKLLGGKKHIDREEFRDLFIMLPAKVRPLSGPLRGGRESQGGCQSVRPWLSALGYKQWRAGVRVSL